LHGLQVDVFGSVKTGLYLPSSDLDIVVFGRWKSRPLFTLSDVLVNDGLCTQDDMRVIEKATVRSVHELSRSKLRFCPLISHSIRVALIAELFLGY